MTKVVHCLKEPYDVYIGRGKCPNTGLESKWGNPYSHKDDTLATYKVATREEAITKYREYLLNNQFLMDSLDELEGKILGCWCHPKPCHGQVLIEFLTYRWFIRHHEQLGGN